MTKEHVVPDYFEKLAEPTDDERWQSIAKEFQEIVDDIESLRFETREEAIGRKEHKAWRYSGPLWEDEGLGEVQNGEERVGIEVYPWFQVAFISEDDREALLDLVELYRSLKPRIAEFIAAKSMTLEFLAKWGSFKYAYGRIHQADIQKPVDVSATRRSIGLRKDLQKIWVAKSLIHLGFPETNRGVAEGHIIKHIRQKMADASPSDEFGKAWYKRILTKNCDNLRSSFKSNLSKSHILELAHEVADLPPLPELDG